MGNFSDGANSKVDRPIHYSDMQFITVFQAARRSKTYNDNIRISQAYAGYYTYYATVPTGRTPESRQPRQIHIAETLIVLSW